MLGGTEYAVNKQGWLASQWLLEHEGEALAVAKKPSVLYRSYDVEMGPLEFTVRARSPITRRFDIVTGDIQVGTIAPMHPFTYKATIECDEPLPELAQLFAFWLAAVTWQRAAKRQ